MYLYGRSTGGWEAGSGRLRPRSSHIVRRNVEAKTIAFIVIAGVVTLVLTIGFCIVHRRKSREHRRSHSEGDAELQKRGLFDRIRGYWRPKKEQYEPAAGDDTAEPGQQSVPLNPTRTRRIRTMERMRSSARNTARNASGNSTVDRNTSVRSVMTLPAYAPMAGTNERVLGREGERDGVDVILDLPTAEEEEALRDEEMETMYQIRATRRQQIAERNERRDQRREARRRHDSSALADLRARTAAANSDTTIRDLRAEVERIKENRQRSVSSVSYADVGIARHDGTRIRANSTESERIGLLSDAASIALSQLSGVQTSTGHNRGHSASSAASIDSDFPSPSLTRSRGESQPNLAGTEDGGRAGSSPELVEADLGDEAMPPPEYEDISLEEGQSTTPPEGPPPDYPGPYRSASVRTERDLATSQSNEGLEQPSRPHSLVEGRSAGRGVGGIPQLPSLRISRLPQIVIEPSSAHPRDEPSRL